MQLLLNLIVLSLFTLHICNSQINCGTDLVHKTLMSKDASYRSAYLQSQINIDQSTQTQAFHKTKDQIFRIPVVVHIIHLGEPVGIGSNISDSLVYAAIQGLNDRFKNVIGNSLDIGIEFCLAIRDPNGKQTNGINRVNGSFIKDYIASGITEQNKDLLRKLSIWPNLEYYNIWVIHRSTYAGVAFAQYPTNPPYFYDGTVITASYMNYKSSTLTHELGHALFLYHTFEGDNDNTICPENFNCWTQGDKICDTDPHKRSACDSNSCANFGFGNWENSKFNYMSYCSRPIDLAKFSPNQKGRMLNTLSNYPRNQYLNSFNCTPCEQIKLILSASVTCQKGIIFLNSTYIQGATYQWTGPKGFYSSFNYTNFIYEDESNNGFYKCEVEIKGCPIKLVDSVYITLYSSPKLSITEFKNTSCYGKNDGSIKLETTDGLPPYNYYWSNHSTEQSQSNLSAGLYSVTVTDYRNCTSSLNIEIEAPEVLTIFRTISICSYDSIFLQGIFQNKIGRYFDSFKDRNDCDSLVITDLFFFPIPNLPIIDLSQNVLNSNFTSGNQWYLNDSIIFGANSRSFTITRNGFYHVVVTDTNGCSFKSNVINFPVTGLIKTISFSNKIILPNPNKGIFRLNLDKRELNRLYIFNLLGELIYQSKDKNITEIDLTFHPKGVYTILFEIESKFYREMTIIL